MAADAHGAGAGMNSYFCMIDLKQDAKALPFAASLDAWMTYLSDQGVIRGWSLCRRKLNLAADAYRDFLLQVEVDDLAQLDRLFRLVGHRDDDDVSRLYGRVHDMIDKVDFALYRPFPDPHRSERVALV